MSVQTLYTAATGMQALETKLDVIANNLANVSTTGFKKDRANFEDLFYHHRILPGTNQTGNPTGVGIQVGMGTRVSSTQLNHTQGAIQQTGRNMDIAIEGMGLLPVSADGNTYYTRAGNLNVNSEGTLVLGSANVGRIVEPQVTIPVPFKEIQISEDGTVSVTTPGNAQPQQVGTIQLAFFPNPGGLYKVGDNLYSPTDASGEATLGTPSQNGLGSVRQFALEASNVEPVRELIDLIQTQRNFELNSQTVQAGDEVMQLISNLRR